MHDGVNKLWSLIVVLLCCTVSPHAEQVWRDSTNYSQHQWTSWNGKITHTARCFGQLPKKGESITVVCICSGGFKGGGLGGIGLPCYCTSVGHRLRLRVYCTYARISNSILWSICNTESLLLQSWLLHWGTQAPSVNKPKITTVYVDGAYGVPGTEY